METSTKIDNIHTHTHIIIQKPQNESSILDPIREGRNLIYTNKKLEENRILIKKKTKQDENKK